uniref:Uncharacterized protein n=1 Tax=Panagrolaimus sp. JU765 TaxID=591449 RepID=A0AC34QYV0_9BILA
MGSREDDLTLNIFLGYLYMVTHYLVLSSPLYIPIVLFLFVSFYRSRLLTIFKRIWRWIRCKPQVQLDYSTETMRSIIAEQTRQRQMKAFGY